MESKKRVAWIDIAKGIAIFLMVCGHTSIPHGVSKWIWSFHMPLFFIVSGMLFVPERYPKFVAFVKRRLQTLIVPYLFFTLVVILRFPEELQIVAGGNSSGALWFLPVLFFTELIGYGILCSRISGGQIVGIHTVGNGRICV